MTKDLTDFYQDVVWEMACRRYKTNEPTIKQLKIIWNEVLNNLE